MVRMRIEQGDIITVEGIRGYFLVVSKNFFNKTEQAILCPIVQDIFLDPLHVKVRTNEIEGIVMCEQMRMVDLRYWGYKRIGCIPYADIIDITDIIQGIFDY